MNRKRVEIFTDGACRHNPGPGGWGALLRYQGVEKEISGSVLETTNNRMELQAAIEALALLKQPCEVMLTTDSKYLMQGITQWLPRWEQQGWRRGNKPILNLDLWKALQTATQQHHISWQWVRAHAGHLENERVDRLARTAIDRMQSKPYD